MSNSNTLPPLEPDKYYHIFNHANGKENLFVKDDNYYYFLKRYTYFSKKATSIKRSVVIEWFTDKEKFWAFHQKEIDEKMALELEY